MSQETAAGLGQAELAAIAASTEDAIVGTRAGVITSWNAGAERLYGYRAGEAVGRPISLLLPPGDPSGPTDLLDRLRRGERIDHFEAVRRRKDGSEVDVSISITPIRDEAGQVVGIASIARDVSDRKRAEAELREREEQYRGVFAATSDGLAIADLETGALVDANPAFCTMHGYGRDELLRLDPTAFVYADDRDLVGDLLAAVRRGELFRGGGRGVRRDGTLFPIEVVGRPFQMGGRPRVLATVRDVTDEAAARRTLEERVQGRTRELSTLLGVARDVASTLELRPLLDVILDQLRTVVDYDAAAVLTPRDGALVPVGWRVPIALPVDPPAMVFSLDRPEVGQVWDALRRGAPVVVDDVYGSSEMAAAVLAMIGRPAPGAIPFARAWLGVPLLARGRPIGLLSIWSGQAGSFTPRHAELADAVAVHAAVAIENAGLHAETARRLREAEVLYRADEALFGSLRVDDVLQALVEVAADLVGADKTSAMLWEGREERLRVRATYGFGAAMDQLSVARGEGVAGLVAATGQPLVVEDAAADPRVARRLVEDEGVRSLMAIPIEVGSETLGVFGVNFCRPHRFAAEERRLLLALARRAAAAIQNARLFDRSERRSRELATLLEVSRTLVGTLALEPLLGVVLDQLGRVIDYGSAAIMTLDGDELVVQDYRGPRPSAEVVGQRFVLSGALTFREVVRRRAPVIIPDVDGDSDLARLFRSRGAQVRQAFTGVRSWLGVPLLVKDRTIGLLRLDHPEPSHFREEDGALALALASQAAVAIENARLYEQAQARATADERQRLARDLHDAVTQTLFSASLIADVLPRVWARDPDQGLARLDEVRQLTRGALAEMRTLLLELRPSALTDTGLGDLLRQLADAFVGRARVPVDLAVEGEAAVPSDVQVALYRVAQEALNNVAKYAAAERVAVRLRVAPGEVDLSVEDDGAGFDPAAVRAGHLGLGIMRERCATVGARLDLATHPGGGTRVAVAWRASG